MARSILDYKTLGALLEDYSRYCQPGEVWLRDSAGNHELSDLLSNLGRKELSARIAKLEAYGDTPTRITTRISGFFSSREHVYEIIWSPNRQGWANPPSCGSRTIHFFVPRHCLTDPPYTSEGMLVSLCKRNWTSNDEPFWPVDSKYTFCKTCQKKLAEMQGI